MEKNCLREKVLIVYIAPILCLLTYLYLYFFQRAAAAKSLQSCPALCNSIDGNPLGSPGPWDSPGKNTGVGCHFLLQCMKATSEREVAQLCLTLSMDCILPDSSVHGIFQARALEWGAIAFLGTELSCINKRMK